MQVPLQHCNCGCQTLIRGAEYVNEYHEHLHQQGEVWKPYPATLPQTPPAPPKYPSEGWLGSYPDMLAVAAVVGPADDITVGQFRELARLRGWSEAWLVEQCRDHMDDAYAIVREILQGRGLTKPWFTGEATQPKRTNMLDTALVWTPLLRLYHAHHGRCLECETETTTAYCSPRCRKRASRRDGKCLRHPQRVAVSAT